LNFFWYEAASIVNVIKCTKINSSEKVLSLIIVTITNAKGCVHGHRTNIRRWGHEGIFPNFFWEGGKSGEVCFFPLETKKTPFLLKFFKSKGASDAHSCA